MGMTVDVGRRSCCCSAASVDDDDDEGESVDGESVDDIDDEDSVEDKTGVLTSRLTFLVNREYATSTMSTC